jgi:surface protein
MKKLLYLFLTVLIVACSGDDGGNDNNDGNNNNDIACEYVLNTLPVTNTIYDSATFNGIISIDSNCEFPITEQGFVYATTIQPTLNDNQVNANGTDVTSTIENLEPDTTYYVRTFLTNALGEFYGNEVSFMTTEEQAVCDGNNPIYLADNGITIKACDDANVGDTGVINGITYTVVDEAMLREMVENEQDVTKLATTKVTDMKFMFYENSTFNQPIGNWDVSNVTNMAYMFRDNSPTGSTFNQPIGNWDVSNVTNMNFMFSNSTFNQPIGNWDVSNVTNMNDLFYNSTFNQPIGNWDVSNVTNMAYMFRGSTFNQPIGNWDVSSVTNMGNMFTIATSYNQDLSSWSVDGVTQCSQFSYGASSWTLPQPNFTNCTP